MPSAKVRIATTVNAGWRRRSRHAWRTSRSKRLNSTLLDGRASFERRTSSCPFDVRAAEKGWRVAEVKGSHAVYVSQPEGRRRSHREGGKRCGLDTTSTPLGFGVSANRRIQIGSPNGAIEGGFCATLFRTVRKPLILKRRDVGVVDRARLESKTCEPCQATPKELIA